VEICTVGSVRGESVGLARVDLNGHEAGNGGYSQGTPTAHRLLSYSERCPVSAPFYDALIRRDFIVSGKVYAFTRVRLAMAKRELFK
jgi:hypothetical protein